MKCLKWNFNLLQEGKYKERNGNSNAKSHHFLINCQETMNNVNFEMRTINSKQELWPKKPKKTSKTMLKTKSVNAGITPFFLG